MNSAYQSILDLRPAAFGPGGMGVPCAAPDPDLHPSQLTRIAALELKASGCLTVELDWKEVAGGRTSKTRNHQTLTPAPEPWGSPHGYGVAAPTGDG